MRSKEKHYTHKLEKYICHDGRRFCTASKLDDDETNPREILAMLKSRLLMKFQSSGHTTAALRALSYASPSAKFKDMTSGIDFYKRVCLV